jgi:peroxiredoxin Q/BCP
MIRPAVCLAALLAFALPAAAELAPGTTAPAFSAKATLGGKEFTFSLADALKSGPVVLYFYPKAFTSGCTMEAHEFAEATPEFEALGATVVGISADPIETLNKFSVEACRSAFPVASDSTQDVMKAFDAVLTQKPDLSNRTSYVIAPDGKIVYAYTDLNYESHVKNTMAALKEWKAANP